MVVELVKTARTSRAPMSAVVPSVVRMPTSTNVLVTVDRGG